MFNFIFILFPFFLLHTSLSRQMGLFGVSPDFIAIGLVLAVSKKGPVDSMFRLGIPLGLLQDFMSSGYFGTGLTVHTVNGFFAGLLRKQTFSDNSVSKAAIAAVIAAINGLLSLLVINVYHGDMNVPVTLVLFTLPSALYTGLVMLVMLTAVEVFTAAAGKVRKSYGI